MSNAMATTTNSYADEVKGFVRGTYPKDYNAADKALRTLVDCVIVVDFFGFGDKLLPSTVKSASNPETDSFPDLQRFIGAIMYRVLLEDGAYAPGGKFYHSPKASKPKDRKISAASPDAAPTSSQPWESRDKVVTLVQNFLGKYNDRLVELNPQQQKLFAAPVPLDPFPSTLQNYWNSVKDAVEHFRGLRVVPARPTASRSNGSRVAGSVPVIRTRAKQAGSASKDLPQRHVKKPGSAAARALHGVPVEARAAVMADLTAQRRNKRRSEPVKAESKGNSKKGGKQANKAATTK